MLKEVLHTLKASDRNFREHIHHSFQMKSIIKNLDSGTKFYLRDIINNPPALLGRVLFEGVADNTIPDVTCLGKIGDAEKYKKN